MLKVKVGRPTDRAKQVLQVNHTADAQTEIDIAGAEGSATQTLQFNEVRPDEVNRGIEELRHLLAAMSDAHSADGSRRAVISSAQEVLKSAESAVRERKLYSISPKGLLEAAKAVGEATSPLVSSAIKVIELLGKATK